jgi:hypothetical protein
MPLPTHKFDPMGITHSIYILTPNTPLIHTSFTYRKLNMDENCGLKFYLSCVHTSQIFLLKSLLCRKRKEKRTETEIGNLIH